MSRQRMLLAACAALHGIAVGVPLLSSRHVVPATAIALGLIIALYALSAWAIPDANWGRILGLVVTGLESLALAFLTFRIWQVYFTGPGVQTFGWIEVVITVAVPVHIATFLALRRSGRA